MNSFVASESVSVAPKEISKFFGITITETMISAFVTVLIILVIAIIIRVFFIPKWRSDTKKVGAVQMFVEWLVNSVDHNAHETVGHNSGFVGFWYFGVVCFIFIGTMIEILGLRPPTSDLSATLALGLTTFILINAFGVKEKKARRIRRYIPNVINIITDFVVPFSMALRLFGSVFSGYLLIHLLYSSMPVIFPALGAPVVGYVIFTFFHALIQSYIFMVLSMNFIGEATE